MQKKGGLKRENIIIIIKKSSVFRIQNPLSQKLNFKNNNFTSNLSNHSLRTTPTTDFLISSNTPSNTPTRITSTSMKSTSPQNHTVVVASTGSKRNPTNSIKTVSQVVCYTFSRRAHTIVVIICTPTPIKNPQYQPVSEPRSPTFIQKRSPASSRAFHSVQ